VFIFVCLFCCSFSLVLCCVLVLCLCVRLNFLPVFLLYVSLVAVVCLLVSLGSQICCFGVSCVRCRFFCSLPSTMYIAFCFTFVMYTVFPQIGCATADRSERNPLCAFLLNRSLFVNTLVQQRPTNPQETLLIGGPQCQIWA
jgi:hypothetical protein